MEEKLRQFYEHYDENGRLGKRAGNVEFVTTMHFVQEYLRPGMRILEVGAATGRYSHHLARMGYQVDGVELLEHNIALFHANTQPGENVTITRGNAIDLSMFEDGTFDLTLVLGPMYHLFEREDRVQALREAARVTKLGGILMAAYCMIDPSIQRFAFGQGGIGELIRDNRIDLRDFTMIRSPQDYFCLDRREDIADLVRELPVSELTFVAADGYAKHMEDVLEAMDEETYGHFLRYHLATCQRPELLGMSHHTLQIMRKE